MANSLQHESDHCLVVPAETSEGYLAPSQYFEKGERVLYSLFRSETYTNKISHKSKTEIEIEGRQM